MTNRLKRVFVLISMGGVAFTWGLFDFGCHPFAENQPYVDFVSDAGTYAVQVGVDAAFDNLALPQNVRDWLEVPVTNLYTEIWQGYVNNTYPEDPVYTTQLLP